MKKRTTKSTKSAKVAAPASSSNADVKPVRKAPVPLVASTPVVKPAPKAPAPVTPVVKPAPKVVPAPVAITAPVVKPAPKVPAKKPAPKPTSTKIAGRIDVGFGNTLYIRGTGPGLSWDRGLAMDCVTDDLWSITLSEATAPVAFKLLLNDITWCAGEDFVVAPGESVTVVPSF